MPSQRKLRSLHNPIRTYEQFQAHSLAQRTVPVARAVLLKMSTHVPIIFIFAVLFDIATRSNGPHDRVCAPVRLYFIPAFGCVLCGCTPRDFFRKNDNVYQSVRSLQNYIFI